MRGLCWVRVFVVESLVPHRRCDGAGHMHGHVGGLGGVFLFRFLQGFPDGVEGWLVHVEPGFVRFISVLLDVLVESSGGVGVVMEEGLDVGVSGV